MIELHYVWTPSILDLKRSFDEHLRSQNSFEIVSYELTQQAGDIAFQSDNWKSALQQKIAYCAEVLNTCDNQIVLFSDIDVRIYDPKKLYDYVTKRFEDEGLNFLAMQEYEYDLHNGGFIFLRRTAQMRDLYHNAAEILYFYISRKQNFVNRCILFSKCGMWKLPFVDQDILNKLVKSAPISYAYIPGNVGCWGDEPITKDTLFHHAVCTTNEQEKINLLEKKQIEYNQFHNS